LTDVVISHNGGGGGGGGGGRTLRYLGMVTIILNDYPMLK